jgi:dTMP kinase
MAAINLSELKQPKVKTVQRHLWPHLNSSDARKSPLDAAQQPLFANPLQTERQVEDNPAEPLTLHIDKQPRTTGHGLYVVIEGLEGCGKTAQAHKLIQYFGSGTLHVREPGGTYMGERLRDIMKVDGIMKSPRANMFLFMSARANLVDLNIRPTVLAGNTVISDRNWLSTLAYQTTEGAQVDQIVRLSELSMGEFLYPDLVILIDTDPAVCLRRLQARPSRKAADQFDYFGQGALRLFRNIRDNYLREIRRFHSYAIVNGNLSPDEVWEQIRTAIDRYTSQ